MNSLFGFVIGMALSLSCVFTLSTLQRRRQLEALEGLIRRGRYRIVKDDGSAAAATELLEAISNSPSRNGDPTQRLIALLLAVILFATTGGLIVFFASR